VVGVLRTGLRKEARAFVSRTAEDVMTYNLFKAAAAGLPLAVAVVAAPAMAQDQSPWNGWYVGGNIGAAWGDSSLRAHVSPGSGAVVIPPADAALINSTGGNNSNKTGFTGGIEGGYNYRMGDWLLGIETEFSALDINERQDNSFQSAIVPLIVGATPTTYHVTQRAKTDWMWTLRPRVGYIMGPWLFYGTAGIATSDIKVSLNYSDTAPTPHVVNADKSSTRTGWTAGLGVGYAVTPNWSMKGEWLYTDFGSVSTTASSPSGFVNLTSDAKVRSNLFRIGADYRF
jgi:outer membrane immunogenic protein